MEPHVREIEIDWWPQDRQLKALQACGLSYPFDNKPLSRALADIIGYGGAAGGGKSDTLLQIAAVAAVFYPKLQIGYFRRQLTDMEGPGSVIPRSQELFGHFAKYNDSKHKWSFPNGSIIQFCHVKDPGDELNYKSQQFDILLLDEVTEFLPEMIDFLITRNRSTIYYETFTPFTACGTNPGGIGHAWFKDGFVTLGEPEKVHIYTNQSGEPETHIYIPAKLEDNQILEKRDPKYRSRLSRNELSKRIYLEGDWDVFKGQAFGELRRDKHIINPIEILPHWNKFGALDHGFNHPFSFGVYVVDDDGNVYRVARVKDRLKRPDEQARLMIKACEIVGGLEKLDYIVAGHDCWAKGRTGEPSLYEQFTKLDINYGLPKIYLRKANIDRIQGANQLRDYIAWKETRTLPDGTLVDGEPRFFLFSNCAEAYDTLATMIFDDTKPEDVMKVDADEFGRGGDDEYDEIRYALMSRPRKSKDKPKDPPNNSFAAILQREQEKRWLKEEYVGY